MPWAGLQSPVPAVPTGGSPDLRRTGRGRDGATTNHAKRDALATQEQDDDELFDLIGAIGAGIGVAKDDGLPSAARQVGTDVAEDAAAKLADLKRLGQT